MRSKKIKSILALITALVMVDTTIAVNLPSSEIIAEAAEAEGTVQDNGFFYIINEEESTAAITGYKDLGPDIELPSKVTVGEKEYKVTSIADNAFTECKSLERIKIPEGITSIGNKAFYNCYNLIKLEMPDTVENLGSDAFNGCTKLSDVNLSINIDVIENNTFYNCTSLKKIILPEKVTLIKDCAFYGCTVLSDLIIPENVLSLGASSFYNCKSIKNINIPDKVTSIGNAAFSDCTNITSVSMADSVTSIGDMVFCNCTNLASVKLSKSLTNLPAYCFYKCSSLENVKLPENINSIGEYAFYECSKLSSIDIPNTVLEIKQYTFGYCSKLSDVKLPEELVTIGNYAFYGCSSMKKLEIPNKLEVIGNSSFSNCSLLNSFIMPDSITNIGNGCFVNCVSLCNLKISKKLSNISDKVFYNCDALIDVKIPEGVETIGQEAFYDCYNLRSIEIPSTVTKIGSNALKSNYQLANIIFINRDSVGSLLDDSYYNYYASFYSKLLTSSNYNEIIYVRNGYPCKVDRDNCYYNLYYNNNLCIKEVYNSSKTYNLVRRTLSSEDYTIEKTIVNSDNTVKIVVKPTDSSNMISTNDSAFLNEIDITNVTSSELAIYIKYSNGEIGKATINLDKVNLEKEIPAIDVNGDLDTVGPFTTLSISRFAGTSGGKVTVSIDGGKEEEVLGDTYKAISNGTYTFTITSNSGFTATKVVEVRNVSNESNYKYTINEEEGTAVITAYLGKEADVIIPEKVINNGKEYMVTSIGEHVFENHSNMISVRIPGTVTDIGYMAFYGCTSLTGVEIPEGVVSIGGAAFARCSSLNSLKIPNSIEKIGSSAFLNCTSLNFISLPKSNVYAGSLMLGGSKDLINVVLKNSVNVDVLNKAGIKIDKFYYKVDINGDGYNEVQLIRKDDGKNTMIVEDDDSYYNLYDGDTLVTDYKIDSDKKYKVVKKTANKDDYVVSGDKGSKDWYSGDVTIKPSAEGSKISMNKSTWEDQVTVKESLNSDMAFYIKDSTGIISKGKMLKDSIKIDKTTPSIKAEGDLEKDCDELTLKLSKNYGKSGIVNVTVSKDGGEEEMITEDSYNVTLKGRYVFTVTAGNGLSSSTTVEVKNINLASNEKDYDYELDDENNTAVVTEYLGNEKSIAIPSTIIKDKKKYTVVGLSEGAFLNSEVLEKVILPNTIKEVSYCAFYGCGNLKSIDMHEGVTNIDEMAFGECKSLNKVVIPSTVKKIDKECFKGCSNLDDISIVGAENNDLLKASDFDMSDYCIVKLKGEDYKEIQVVKSGTEFVVDSNKYYVYNNDDLVEDKVITKDVDYRLEINK